MIKRKKWMILLCLLLLTKLTNAQFHRIEKITLDTSSIYIYFNDLPTEYKSILSNNKQKVTIKIPNCEFDDKFRSLPSSETIKDIFLTHKSDTTIITINLNEQYGYTAVPLPYSKTIFVEFFKWNQLNKSEDLLREALLGIETGIYDKAKENLEKSVDYGNAVASFYLALLNLYDGKLKTGFKNLLYSINKKVEIPDLFAAISQILEEFQFTKEANYYKNIFTQKTGLEEFPKLIIGSIPDGDSLDRETIELLMKINLSKNESFEKLKDSLNIAINKINQEPNEEIESDDLLLSFFPKWFIDYFLIIISILIILAIFLIISYQRWKRKQLLLRNEKVIKINKDFENDLNQAKSSDKIKQKAIQTYIKIEDNNNQKKPDVIADKDKDKKNIHQKSNDNSKNNAKNDEDFQAKIEKLAQQITEIQDKKRIKELDEQLPEKEEGLDAKTKLAIHLQEKNFLTKQELISKLEDLKIQDSQSIDKLAQKMKIEKSIIDTKSKIKSLDEDTEKLKELKEKFKVDENNNNDNT